MLLIARFHHLPRSLRLKQLEHLRLFGTPPSPLLMTTVMSPTLLGMMNLLDPMFHPPRGKRKKFKICSKKLLHNKISAVLKKEESNWKKDSPTLWKGFDAISSSLSHIGGTIGNALEVAMAMAAEAKLPLQELKTLKADLSGMVCSAGGRK
ncbi:hypothetical protein O6P43_014177 [Quillaja saponaria]|uniref:Uncharacterized protein n=1 Tax=Quillaja saponaria TaxID=32244 RepID=A0AAD7LU41_QUISA|nr:hypothetical protein O6P43_014177 [Quillaja saponaria]